MITQDAKNFFAKANEAAAYLMPLVPEREEVIRTAFLALATGLNHYQKGEPGTGKTYLPEIIAAGIHDADVFYKQLSKATPIDELFGATSIQGIKQEDYRRAIDGFLPTCHVAILDEIANAGAALINSLLRMMNERKYQNGRSVVDVPLISVFGMSNDTLEGAAFRAFDSRWTFRHEVHGLSEAASFAQMINANRTGEVPDVGQFEICVDEILAARRALSSVTWEDESTETLWALREEFHREGLAFDDRKAVWIARSVLPAEALMRGREVVTLEDFEILQHVLWSKPADIEQVRTLVLRTTNPLHEWAEELVKTARKAYKTACSIVAENRGDEAVKIQATTDARAELTDLIDTIKAKASTTSVYERGRKTCLSSIKKIERIDQKVITEIMKIRS